MIPLFDRAVAFFAENIPTWRELALGGPAGLAWAFACLAFAGWLKRRGVRTGYTRKVFHFLVFTTVAGLHAWQGTRAVCLFGAMSSLAVFFAVWRGRGNLLYEAMAREKDEPHRTHFILVPYFTTLFGGLVANIAFGPAALAGYLVAGLGDAIGEPVGTRFGCHPYRVPSRKSVPATRTLEGSAAVFVASFVALLLASTLLGTGIAGTWPRLLAIALASAVAEAVSPHGWDNATMQLVPAALFAWWLT